MLNRLVVALLTVGLTAAPAFAENIANPNQSAGSNTPSSGMQAAASLKQSLQKAGFKNIQIGATSYVHAEGPDGNPVVMMITPDSITGVVESPRSSLLANAASDQPASTPRPENGFQR